MVFDPVARALDLIGDKWTLVLVRHLLVGPVGFQHLRVRTGITARVLSARLRQLVSHRLERGDRLRRDHPRRRGAARRHDVGDRDAAPRDGDRPAFAHDALDDLGKAALGFVQAYGGGIAHGGHVISN